MIRFRFGLIGPIVKLIGPVALVLIAIGCAGGGEGDATSAASPKIEDPFATEPYVASDAMDRRSAGRTPVDPAPDSGMTAADGRISIVLGTFSAGDHQASAQMLRQEFVAVSSMNQAWVESEDDRSILRYGRYEDFSSPRARADLKQIQSLEINQRRPFARAFLAPIRAAENDGGATAYNLLSLRQRFPQIETLYSLQIAAFQAEPRSEARRAAEQLVAQLRSEGEEAYFYHGPSLSHVTIGVFFADAIDPATGILSPEVAAVKKRYQYNTLNGREILETTMLPNGERRQVRQESFLVPVPRQ